MPRSADEKTGATADIRTIRSRTGRDYRVFISRPLGPAQPLPVLFLLDGNATFPLAKVSAGLQSRRPQVTGVGPALIVGIGYPIDGLLDSGRRVFDYTPAVPPGALGARPGDSPWPPTGGADAFLDFIEGELKPMLTAELPVDLSNQSIFGYSLGGLLVLHALLSRPGCFHTYGAASPSIWFANRTILSIRDAYAARDGALRPKARLLVTVGGLEQTPPIATEGDEAAQNRADWVVGNRMVDNARELAASLATLGNLDVKFAEFSDETHGTVLPAAVSRFVSFALGRQRS